MLTGTHLVSEAIGNGTDITPVAHAGIAVDFLRRFHPTSPWALATFGPGAGEIGPAATFHPSEENAARRFIASVDGRHNVYFSVNHVSWKLAKKAAKTDIAEVHWLHVDVDLAKTLDWTNADAVAAERSRVLHQLRTYEPQPTAIVWSGGGFQAFWRLSEIIVVNGDKARMGAIERRMQHIERRLGGDACHNADRIMRLPGTLNVLGPTKNAAGRKSARAELVEFHDDYIYDLEEFPSVEAARPSYFHSQTALAYSSDRNDMFERARDALQAIPADDRNVYLRIGMALKSEFGDAGFSLHRDWAMRSIKFDDTEHRRTWASISPEGDVTIGTLFGLARYHGWRDERRSRAEPGHETRRASAGMPPDMSLIRRNQHPAAPFPLEVLGPAADWVKATAESKSAPVDYVALALLVTAAGLIGPKRRVSPWGGWYEPSILWGALVGPPSVNKSPAMDPLRDAVRDIERMANADCDAKKAGFETDKKVAEARRELWEQEVGAAVKAGKEPPTMPGDAVVPQEPPKHRLLIVDATTEKVARILGENPGGLLCFRDELAGLLGGFDKYGGSGSDRAFWIEAYGGRSYRYDRVGLKDGSVDIAFCAVSLLGALQPDRLNTMLLSGDDDGLASRPLYAWPDPVAPRRPSRPADEHQLVAALRRLSEISFDPSDDGDLRPRTISLESDAADEFQAWWEHKQWDAKLNASGRLAGAVGKLDGKALRLAQVLELLAWAWCQATTLNRRRLAGTACLAR